MPPADWPAWIRQLRRCVVRPSPRAFLIAAFLAVESSVMLALPAAALTIEYVVTDIADETAGEDLFRYEYFVSEGSFEADQGFSIFFEVSLFGDLRDPAPVPGWDIITIDPDPLLPDEGFYDALALIPLTVTGEVFTVDFVWLGPAGSLPGSQSFEVYDVGFKPIEFGRTVARGAAPIPEPGAAVVFCVGLVAISRTLRGPRYFG